MKLIEAYAKLRSLKLPFILTQDASAYLEISVSYAAKILTRLAEVKQIIHIAHGKWIFPDTDILALPEILTSPFPAYISLQTALYFHGMISQIPSTVYAVSVARTRFYTSAIADVSIHHIQPEFFFGYEEKQNGSYKIATPEKALIDLLYLSPGKSRLFAGLPELEIIKNFKLTKAKNIIAQIPSVRTRSLVTQRLQKLLS